MKFPQIAGVQSEMEAYFEAIETEQYDDLEMYFSGKLATLNVVFETKAKELKKDQELLVSQSENKFQKFKNTWMEKLMEANINNIKELNIEFDSVVPSIDADTFFSFKDDFIESTKNFRNKLIDITNACKLQQEQLDEKKRIEEIKNSIKLTLSNLDTLIETMELKDIKNTSNSIQKMELDFKKAEYYSEFKDLIESKLLYSRNAFAKNVKVIESEAKETARKDEEKRIANAKASVKGLFEELSKTVTETTFETLIIAANDISTSIVEVRANKIYPEFKDLIELNISNIENTFELKQNDLIKKNADFEASEKVRIAKEKEDAKKKLALNTKRKKELKPFKESAVSQVSSITIGYFFDCKNKDVQGIMNEFLSDVSDLQDKYIKQIKEL